MAAFADLNNDQRREVVNTRQRYQAWRAAADREFGFRGSMVWEETAGRRYLLRSSYGPNGKRVQRSLGPENDATIATKATFDTQRAAAVDARKALDEVIDRQAAINRALGLGRMPLLPAKIVRLLDRRGLLGRGVRVAGTNALYAYEAACGLMFDSSVTATDDVDLLFDTRRRLYLIGDPDLADDTLVQLLRRADRSFTKSRQSFRAQNQDGYLVDLIKPMPVPPWRAQKSRLGTTDDLEAAEIEGLAWLENAPSFEHTVIDERGYPLRLVTIDPRAFAIHKHWVSTQSTRDPVKRKRDAEQASLVAGLVREHLQHLPFDPAEFRMFPKNVLEAALETFKV